MTEAVTTEADGGRQPSRVIRALKALKDRRMAAMLLLSFAASLPYGAVLGVLTAWLTEENVGPAVIGALSLATIGYAFKYLWAPAFQRARDIPLFRLGGRRSWLVLLQILIAVLLAVLAFSNPAQNIGVVAVIAFAITILSPTHDIVLDAWRIEVARSEEDKDLMSALYQFGYKFGGLISGFVALMMAARIGWVAVYIMLAAFMLLSVVGSLLAPEPETEESVTGRRERPSFQPAIPGNLARGAIAFVSLCWLAAFLMIGNFVVGSLILDTGVKGHTFVSHQGPVIVALTVLVPALVAAYLLFSQKAEARMVDLAEVPHKPGDALTNTLFRAIFDPLMDLIYRLRWGVILVLALALTYRFTDAVWGSFAYAFYMGQNFGALGHSPDDVAIASKFFGVIATILGSLVGVIAITVVGRMPVFFVGGILAAVTNLLYADLAVGGAHVDAFLAVTHLDVPLVAFANWAAEIQPKDIVIPPDQGQRMARLMVTIFAENIAGGLALVAVTAYLTSVVNPRFAAVQYALLASLTMLIGTLGKPWLGELMETRGFYHVFIMTFWLGGIAVVLSAIEWVRQAHLARTAERV
jgi:PAT family beta-lactamase induction signal transducer AmpG